MDVSVIVVNYNTYALTCSCIQSIYDKTHSVTFEIILVDNASTECPAQNFLERFPEIHLITNDNNIGFGRANNQAMACARGKYFLLINSDSYLLNSAIDIAYEWAEERKSHFSVFGADIRNEDLSPQRSFYYHRRISVANTLIQSLFFENILIRKLYFDFIAKMNNTERESRIGGLYGSYIFLARTVFDETGGFDPDFFMYCEETEWFRNRIYKTFNVDVCWPAKVVHLGGMSSDKKVLDKNNVLSYYLYWYKIGYVHYIIYTFFSYLNIGPNLVVLPFMGFIERRRHWLNIRYRLSCLKKVIFEIPKYSNMFGARNEPLCF